MISLLKFKQLLVEEVKGLSDEEIEQIRGAQYQFTKLAFDKRAKERGLIKNTTQKSNNVV